MSFSKAKKVFWRLVLFLLSSNLYSSCIPQKRSPNNWTHFSRPCINGNETALTKKVYPIKQRKANDCWFACYGTLLSWKEQRRIPYEELYDSIGIKWQVIVNENNGIDFPNQKIFFEEMNLGYFGPANYIYEGYVSMLEEHGPLWISMGSHKKSFNHARVLLKLSCGKSMKRTYFYLFDPAKDRIEKWNAKKFFKHFENEAKEINEEGYVIEEWRYQIIYIK